MRASVSAKFTPAAATSMRTWPGPQRRARALLDLQDLGPAVTGDDDDAHRATLPAPLPAQRAGSSISGIARASRRAARRCQSTFSTISAITHDSSIVASTLTCGGTPWREAP